MDPSSENPEDLYQKGHRLWAVPFFYGKAFPFYLSDKAIR